MSGETKVRDYTREKLYELVPAIYRQLDAKSGKPLEALLKIISRQVDVVEDDIAGLYDNWFVETCDEWVTAYIADLVGARSLETSRVSSQYRKNAETSQRAYIANTIAYRRRKGTLAVLEQLSKDITNWDSHAVEFFQLLETTQHLNHLRLANHRTPDLRDTDALELLDGPFDRIAHTVEVRRIPPARGYYNISNIGIFLWRLQSFLSDGTPACRVESGAPEMKYRCFTFHPLGYDEPIFNTPATEAGIASISGETNVSAPIRIRALYENLRDYYGRSLSVTVRYADELEERRIPAAEIQVCNLAHWLKPEDGKVAVDPVLGRICLSKDAADVRLVYYYGFSGKVGGGFYTRQESELAPAAATYRVSSRKAFVWSDVPADAAETDHLRAMLRNDYGIDWLKPDTALEMSVDGRKLTATQDAHQLSITLGTGNETADLNSDGVDVATLYPRQIGGKTYVSEETDTYRSVSEAVLWWKEGEAGNKKAVIEIADSEVYPQDIDVALAAGSVLEIRAGQEERPILLGALTAKGEKNSRLVLDGLCIDSHKGHSALTVGKGEMESIAIRHCTIVPTRDAENENFAIGLESQTVCEWEGMAQQEQAAKLREFLAAKPGLGWVPEGAEFEKHSDAATGVEYASYKTGGGQELRIEAKGESSLATLKTRSSAGGHWKKVYEFSILTQDGKRILYAHSARNDNLEIEIKRSICGAINIPGARLAATDSIVDGRGKEAIVTGTATIEQSTIFGMTVVDELALASNSIFTGAVNAKTDQKGCARFSYISSGSNAPRKYKCQPSESTPDVGPRFTSEQYGDPGYAQLHRKVDVEIFEGADNGAEMGAFNHLLQAHRISDLRSALDEYLRFGLEAGVFLVT
jgi:hypothetical protein